MVGASPSTVVSVAANDLLGQVLDERYRIERKLGEGGMGFVFAGTHVTLGSKIAIKTLHPRLAFERKYRERFLLEAKAADLFGTNKYGTLNYRLTANVGYIGGLPAIK